MYSRLPGFGGGGKVRVCAFSESLNLHRASLWLLGSSPALLKQQDVLIPRPAGWVPLLGLCGTAAGKRLQCALFPGVGPAVQCHPPGASWHPAPSLHSFQPSLGQTLSRLFACKALGAQSQGFASCSAAPAQLLAGMVCWPSHLTQRL